MNDYSHFAKDANRWEADNRGHMGVTWHFPPPHTILHHSNNLVMPISHFPGKGLGRPQEAKAWYGLPLIVLAQAVEEERKFRLVAMWVHHCQTLISSLEEAAKKLALLINTADDWPYTFMQLCEDSQHVPLSDAGHISIMVDGAPSKSACRCLSCLEVCRLLQCGNEVVYLEGLNGGLKPIWVTLPKQLVWDTESTNEPVMLQVNLPRTTHRDVTMAASQWLLMPISFLHSVTECLSDTVTRPSMEKEVERLLSGTLSNTPEQSCAPVSPRRPLPMVPNTPAASKEKAPLDLGETISIYPKQPPPSHQESSQVGMVNITAHSCSFPHTGYSREEQHPQCPKFASLFYHSARWCPTPSRGDEWCHGSPTHLQGLSRCPSVKADIWVGDSPLPEWNQTFQSHQQDRGPLCSGTTQYWGCLCRCHERGRGHLLSLH